MERIKHALAEARQQRERLRESSVAKTLNSMADDTNGPGSPSRGRFNLMRDARVWFGIAFTAIVIAMLAWTSSLKQQARTTNATADTAAKEARSATFAGNAQDEKLARLQARVNLLNDSVTRVDDKLTDMQEQLNAISTAIDSATISRSEATTEVLATDRAPLAAIEQEDKPVPAPDTTSDPTAAQVLTAEQKSATTVEGSDTSLGGSSRTPDEATVTEALSVEEKSLVSVALFRSPEALRSLRHSDRKTLGERSGRKATDSNMSPEEVPTETASAGQTSVGVRGGGPWVINLVSYSDERDANRFAKRAQSRSIHVEQNQVTVKGKPYWRVQVPGFLSAEDAKTHAASIETKLGLKDTWVMRR
jgi:hypothetical protein